jgi:hypothetical protein
MTFYDVSFAIFNIFTFINVLASVVTLILIIKMKKYNGYMLMLSSMTIAEFCYDSSLFLFNFPQNEDIFKVQLFFGIFAGTAASLWSLVFSFVLSYIIFSKKYFDIGINFPIYFVIVFVLSIWDAIVCVANVNVDQQDFGKFFFIFNIFRIAFLVVNIMVLMYVFISLFLQKNDPMNEKCEKKTNPIYVIAKRLCLYPIVQLISRYKLILFIILIIYFSKTILFFYRIPISIYQLIYKQPLFGYELTQNHTSTQRLVFLISVVLTPSAGVGNFISFISVQAEAKNLLYRFFCINKRLSRPESFKLNHNNSMYSENSEVPNSLSEHSKGGDSAGGNNNNKNYINKLGSYYNSSDDSRDTNISYYDDHVIIQTSDMDTRSSSFASSIASYIGSTTSESSEGTHQQQEVNDYYRAFSISQRNLSKQQHNFDTAEIGPDGRISFSFERGKDFYQAKKISNINSGNLDSNNKTEIITTNSQININYDLLDEEQLLRHISYQNCKQNNDNNVENSVENPITNLFSSSSNNNNNNNNNNEIELKQTSMTV